MWYSYIHLFIIAYFPLEFLLLALLLICFRSTILFFFNPSQFALIIFYFPSSVTLKRNPQPLLGPQGPAIQFGSWFPLRLYLPPLCPTLAPVPSNFTPIIKIGFPYFETSGTIADMAPSPWNTPLSSTIVPASQIFFIPLPDFLSPAQKKALPYPLYLK